MLNIRLRLICGTLGCIASLAYAQPYVANLRWQASQDGGASWHDGTVVVARGFQSVLVRLKAEWNSTSSQIVFAGTNFDATVRSLGRVSGDWVDQFDSGSPSWTPGNYFGFTYTRFGGTLKIDDVRDVDEPGTGPRWIQVQQAPPTIPPGHPENPTILFRFRLRLDGDPGCRRVSAVFRPYSPSFPTHVAALWIPPYSLPVIGVPTIISDLDLVVPCPADFDDGTASGTPDGGVTIDDLLYFLALYADGALAADLSSPATPGTPDGGVTIDDLLYYLDRYEGGC